MLEKVVKEDPKNRFSLLYKLLPIPGSSSGSDVWWIRANQGHSLVRWPALHVSMFSEAFCLKAC
jgi:RNA:NAD 2'-phosphotransferase (TPT1/KptA family)